MQNLLWKFWHSEDGFVLAMEWIYVASILTLGTIAGMMLSTPHGEDDNPPKHPVAMTR
jgi:hypothetical protein